MYKLMMLLSLCLIPVIQGCQSTRITSEPTAEMESRLLAGEPFFDARVSASDLIQKLPDDRPFQITDEMKHFAHYYAPDGQVDYLRLRNLVEAVSGSGGLGLSYDTGPTLTAKKAFELQKANCLSFSLLFVALAQEIGLDVSYNEVDVPPLWDIRSENKLIYYRHVNVVANMDRKMRFQDAHKVIDVNYSDYDMNYPQQYISRDTIEAQYYNNRGAELMYEDHNQAAFLYYRKSLEINSKLGYVWGNLGTLYRRAQVNDLALAAYQKALYLDSRDVVTMSNISALYRSMGAFSLAEPFEKKVEIFRQKNPYYHYSLALTHYHAGEYAEAKRSIKDALAIYQKDHRFYYLDAILLAGAGNFDGAYSSLEVAQEVAIEKSIKDKYGTKLDRLESIVLQSALEH